MSDVVLYEGNLYFSSIGDGLYNQTSGEIIENIPQSNVELDTVITALAARGNLWVSSFSNQNPIHRYDGEQWISYSSAKIERLGFVIFE